jgi:integrase
MSIYSDRGQFRVEVQLKGIKYRGRFKDYKDAQIAELLWKAGRNLPERLEAPSEATLPDTRPKTLLSLLKAAEGALWKGQADRKTSIRRTEILFATIGLDKDPLTVTQTEIDTAVEALERDRQIMGSTLNRYLCKLTTVTRWAAKYGWANTYEVEYYPESEGRIRTISADEELTLLSLMGKYGRDDVASLIQIALATGMRRGEMLRITLDDIQGRRLTLGKTKNGSPHYLTLTHTTLGLLQWYLSECEPLTARELRYWWDRARAEMGLTEDKWFTWHAMRHTAATRALKAGVDVRVVQKMLNHRRIETTLRYTHVDDTQVENALAAISPQVPPHLPPLKVPPVSRQKRQKTTQLKNRCAATVQKGGLQTASQDRMEALRCPDGGIGRRAGFRLQRKHQDKTDVTPSDN